MKFLEFSATDLPRQAFHSILEGHPVDIEVGRASIPEDSEELALTEKRVDLSQSSHDVFC